MNKTTYMYETTGYTKWGMILVLSANITETD